MVFFRVVKRKELNIANLSQIIHECVHTVPLFLMSNSLTRSDTCFLSAIRGVIGGRGLDELPELFNILIGDMSVVGPRPLLVRYLERYSEEQRHRHDVRPGLTGYAQCHGRNAISWKEKFEMDVWYTMHISLFGDIKILFETVFSVFKREGINSETSATMEEFMGNDE